MKDRKGFSLIELMGVLVIIGLILLVVIPAVSRLLTSNDKKQYNKYLDIIEAGAIRYADTLKDDLGGHSDTGCVDNIDINDLIEEKYIKEYNDDKVICTGKVRLDNKKGNLKVSIDLTCKNKDDDEVTFEVKNINDEDACIAYEYQEPIIPGNPNTPGDSSTITLANKILKDNVAYPDNENSEYVNNTTPGISFGAISSDTNGKGLYITSDLTRTEDIDGDGTGEEVYYYRGAVTNNFVQFGAYPAGTTVNGTTYSEETPIYWKIIRINEDGSIRMIYNGTSADATGDDATIGKSAFNSSYNDNAYVGYMYGLAGRSTYAATHANDNPSAIKTYIDNWYSNSTNLSTLSNNYLADAGFCNDRSLGSGLGYAKNSTYYGAYNRLRNEYQPQFTCPNADNDLFTTSESSKGNKALSNPIGLITADEVSYAGGVYSNLNNGSYYLYTGAYYWTMSPYYLGGSTAQGTLSVHMWNVNNTFGRLYYRSVKNSDGVRPVVNLQSTVELSDELPSGCTGLNGTATCPYIIKIS